MKRIVAVVVTFLLLGASIVFYIADWDKTTTTANTLAALSVVAGVGFYLLGWTPRSSGHKER